MVTLEQYKKLCSQWTEQPETFAWLIDNCAIVGTSCEELAQAYEFANTTVERWAQGLTVPHIRIQQLIVDNLGGLAQSLLEASLRASLPGANHKHAHAAGVHAA